MTGYEDEVPAYLTFRVTAQDGPIAAFADQEAWQARERYPDLMGVGLPEFFHAVERDTGGWELSQYGSDTPQGSRDSLGSHFRKRANEAEEAGDAKAHKEWMAGALRMDREVVDEVRVRGERFRIVRASRFIRMGRSGPEPPRPSDPDPAEVGEAHQVPSRTRGFVVDPYIGTGMSEGLLKLDLVRFVSAARGMPPEVRRDALLAQERCPGGVLLPAVFMISERVDGRWKAHNPSASHSTPQGARDYMASYLRVMAPFEMRLPDEVREEYARAADVLDEKRGNSLSVAGRRFRVVRAERLIRIGPDGPEGPRPSDYDPDPPVEVQTRQLKEQGLWREEDEVEADAAQPDARFLEFKELMEQEQRRAAAAKERRARNRGNRGNQGNRGNAGDREDPGAHGNPGVRGNPGDPRDPGAPGGQGNPRVPGDPGGQGNPRDPGAPGGQGNPRDPGDPGGQGNPRDPGGPGDPRDLGDPGDPGDPGVRGNPGGPGDPGVRGNPGDQENRGKGNGKGA